MVKPVSYKPENSTKTHGLDGKLNNTEAVQ